MRVPWPFRRATSDGGAAADAGAADPGGSDATLAGGAAPWTGGTRSRDAWRSLPPLAETIGEPPLIAPVKPFRADLAGATPPPPILPALRHGRGLEAPQGLVVGLARPAAASAPAGSTSAGVQRSPLRPATRAASRELPAAGPDDELPAAAGAPLEPTAADAAVEPPRHLSTGSSASGPRLDLTRAALDVRAPSGVVRHPVPVATPIGLAGTPAIQRAPEAAAVPLPAAGAGDQGPSRQPAAMVRRAPLVDGPSDRAEAPRLTVGQARRLGLGAPISGGPVSLTGSPTTSPPTALVQRAPAIAPSSIAEGERAGAATPRLGDSPGPNTTRPLAMPTEPGTATAVPGATTQPASRSIASRPAQIEPAVAATASHALAAAGRALTVGVQRSPRRPAPETSPSVPLRSQIQRAPLVLEQGSSASTEPAPQAASGSTSVPSVSGSITVHRGPDATDLSSAMESRSFTHGGEIYLPASHGPLSSGPARSLLAHEMTHVAQQRRLGSSLPHESSRSGQVLEAEAVQAERTSNLPLAPTSKASTEPGEAGAVRPQRAPDPAAQPPAVPSHDTTTVHVAADVQRAPAATGPTAKSAAPVPGASGRPKPTERELDDLARQLYARIGRRLQRDLLVDRERAGMAVDLS